MSGPPSKQAQPQAQQFNAFVSTPAPQPYVFGGSTVPSKPQPTASKDFESSLFDLSDLKNDMQKSKETALDMGMMGMWNR
jgi:hypothetical protein